MVGAVLGTVSAAARKWCRADRRGTSATAPDGAGWSIAFELIAILFVGGHIRLNPVSPLYVVVLSRAAARRFPASRAVPNTGQAELQTRSTT
jgi:hypothetical protein